MILELDDGEMNSPILKSASRQELMAALGLLMAVAFCLYANTFGNAWTYDDFVVIVENPDVRSLSGFLSDSYPGRPLREFTYLLDHLLFGLKPAGWHIQNIFWHGLNAWLLFLVVCRLGGGRLAAWIASALFLAHPIQVEVVAAISHRKDSLLLALALMSFLAYQKIFDGSGQRLRWFAAASLLAVGACLAKQGGLLMPLVFLVYELGFVSRDRRFLLKWPVFLSLAVVGGAASLWFWVARLGGVVRYLKVAEMNLQKIGFVGDASGGDYLLILLKSWSFSLLNFLFPVDLALEYTFSLPESWLDLWVVCAFLVIGGYVLFLCLCRTKAPASFFYLAWIGIFLLPVSNIIWPGAYFVADRYFYASSAGFFALMGVFFARGVEKRRAFGVFVVSVVLVFAILSWKQNRVWESSFALWQNAVRVSPRSTVALNNLGRQYRAQGNLPMALEYYRQAAENPYNDFSHYNLGRTYEDMGDIDNALSHYKRFLEFRNPKYRKQASWLVGHLKDKYGIEVTGL